MKLREKENLMLMPPYKASNPTHKHCHECLNKTSLAADTKTTCFPSDCHLINDCELQSYISESVLGGLLYFWYFRYMF
jgi:hypothetical protein